MANQNTKRISGVNPFKQIAKGVLSSNGATKKQYLEAVTGCNLVFEQQDGKYKLQQYGNLVNGRMCTEEQFNEVLQNLEGEFTRDRNDTVVTAANCKKVGADEFKRLLEDIMNETRFTMRAWREVYLIEKQRRRTNAWIFVGGVAVVTVGAVAGKMAYDHFKDKNDNTNTCDNTDSGEELDTEPGYEVDDDDIDEVQDISPLDGVSGSLSGVWM